MKTISKLWVGVGVLALLSPLGLYLPEKFKAGNAWGEWNAEKFKDFVGYVPQGLGKLSSFWRAALPGYSFKGAEDAGLKHLSLAYIVSAAVGVVLIAGIVFLIGKLVARKGA